MTRALVNRLMQDLGEKLLVAGISVVVTVSVIGAFADASMAKTCREIGHGVPVKLSGGGIVCIKPETVIKEMER